MPRPRLYVDSADTDAVAPLLRDRLVAGVTTNPTILERAGRGVRDIPELYSTWDGQDAREIFFQTWGENTLGFLRNADELRILGERIVVKVPATRAGFAAASSLIADGVPVLVTAVYTAAQALVSASIGARYIAPYLGRMRDAGRDGIAEIAEMVSAMSGSDTDVLAASLRSPSDIVQLHAVGVTCFTAAPTVIDAVFVDDVSESTAAEFEAAVLRA